MIYKYRNEIVHNAHYENTIIPFYVKKAKRYSGNLLREIIKQYSKEKMNIEKIVTKYLVNYKNFTQKLEQNQNRNIINMLKQIYEVE